MAIGENTRSDWELVEAVRAGSHDAFAVLVARYQNQVASLAYLSMGSRADAEDLTQEVFYRFYQSIDRLSQRDSVFPWIYRIAVNLCIDESRKRAIRRVLSLDFLVGEGHGEQALTDASADPAGSLEESEARSRLHAAIARMPARSRIVLLMRDFEDLPYQDIAEILGVSVQTVKTRLFRARKQLASLMRPRRPDR